MTRRVATLLATLGTIASTASAGANAATWEAVPLPPPPGGQFSTPAGLPGDLKFWAPNRGLMTVAGNNSVPAGVYSWDGQSWHQLATVCGGGAAARIAWAGPTEFWTIAAPSPGVRGVFGSLCRFKDGAVVGSFATTNVAAYTTSVESAACLGPNDCWFAGVESTSGDGTSSGAFHLHWDGTALTSVYAPQGRAVTDLEPQGGELHESVRVGPSAHSTGTPTLRDPEAIPALLHRVAGGTFANDAWLPAPIPGVPDDGTELYALDSDGTTSWAVGGGATSGPAAAGGRVSRLPVAARLVAGTWTDVKVRGSGLTGADSFDDVAAIPGTDAAWATLNSRAASGDAALQQPRLAYIAGDGEVTVTPLAGPSDPLRGAATRVECPAADDCWMATARGFLYRWGGPKPYAVDSDPAFQGTITERPNEGAAQFLPDTPPGDDSRLFAPPVELPTEDETPPTRCARPAKLMSGVRRPETALLKGQNERDPNARYRLTISFRLARNARVALLAERRTVRGGRSDARSRGRARARRVTRVVARTPLRVLRRGRRSLSVVVSRSTWPNGMRFVLREAGRIRCVAVPASVDRSAATR